MPPVDGGSAAAAEENMTEEELLAQAEANFDAGYAGEDDRGEPDEPETAEDEAEEPEEPEESEGDPEPVDEPPQWAKDLAAKIEAHEGKLDSEVRRIYGKLGEYGSKLKEVSVQDAQDAARDVAAAGGDAPSQERIKEAINKHEDMQELLSEFPEWGKATMAQAGIFQQYMEERFQEFEEKLASNSGVKDNEAEVQQMKSAMVELRHPGWVETVRAPEFSEWLEAGPQKDSVEIQNLRESDSPLDVIKLLDRYAADQGKAEGDSSEDEDRGNDDRREAAAEPTKGRRQPGGKRQAYDPEKAFDEGFNNG